MFLYRVLLKKVKRVYKWPRPPGPLKKECSTLVYLKKKQSREWSGLICLLEMKTCIHTLAVRLHP